MVTPEETTKVLAVGGPHAGVWLEIHGPVRAHLPLPYHVETEFARAVDDPRASVEYETHTYALSFWSFAGRKLCMYLHLPTQAEGEDAVNTALAEAVFHPEVFEQWKAAPRPEQLPEWAREH